MSDSAAIVTCPACAIENPLKIGRLPDVSVFAGRDADEVLPASSLYRCVACGLLFRQPVLPPSAYDRLYARSQAPCWSDATERVDWELVTDYLGRNAHAGASVLDFGCNTGGLLERVGSRYSRTGIEVNETAAERARQVSGAQVFASLDALPSGQQFDFVTAVDVVEHFADPGSVIASLLRVVKPGGALIVTTGDASSGLWRLAGARWWYCYYPEHLAFISEHWIRGWLRRTVTGAFLADACRFRHEHLAPLPYLRQACLTSIYLAAPPVYSWLVPRLKRLLGRPRRPGDADPPGSGLTRDHVFLVLRQGT